jgi:hypothetical protein
VNVAEQCAFCQEVSTTICARCRRELCPFHRLTPTQRCPHCELQWNAPNRQRTAARLLAATAAGALGAVGAYGLLQLGIVQAVLGKSGDALLLALPAAMTIGTYRWVESNVFRRRFMAETVHALPTAKIVGTLR